MKPHNTRISPTTNGYLHVGHILTALINEYEAHSTGGKFIVRFDDEQEIWGLRQGEILTNKYKENTKHVFEKLGIEVDHYRSDSEMPIDEFSLELSVEKFLPMRSRVMVDNAPDWANHDTIMYPYHPYLTARKVVADFLDSINLVIRGEDLLTEFSLYSYFCDVLRIPIPEHIYIARLRKNTGAEISKSKGEFPSVQTLFDEGWTREDILALLRKSCLLDPRGSFSIKNIKNDPRLPNGAWK